MVDKNIRALGLKCGLIVDKVSKSSALRQFIGGFREASAQVELVRIGRRSDGGYLLPNDLAGIKYCFSPGVDTTADFEEYLAANYGIRSFLADASVDQAPVDNPLFEFDKKFLGAQTRQEYMTLSSWIENKVGLDTSDDLILQMDIEGSEFDVLIETPLDVLRRFRVMAIEFHNMDRIFNKTTLPLMNALFQKVHSAFSVVHLHANNCCGLTTCGAISVPRVFEITYLRNDRVAAFGDPKPLVLPHPLDRKNLAHKPDVVMPDIWWR